METIQMNDWIDINTKLPKDAVIKTLHTDGKEDVCRVINDIIYTFDSATSEPITHYKVMQLIS